MVTRKGWILILMASLPAFSADWGQFRGPERNGISAETGLLRSWGERGPEELWRVPIGAGFSGISKVAERLYTMDSDKEKEYLLCAEAQSGKTVWRTPLAGLFTNNFGNGPRATPTVDGKIVYALASEGVLAALNGEDGSILWQKDIKQFGGAIPQWAFCASPLVVDDQLIVEVGGTEGRNLASFDKQSGDLRWTALDVEQAYNSPMLYEWNGVRQLIVLNKEFVAGLSLGGEELWRSTFQEKIGIKPAPPVLVGDDKILVSASYDAGAKLIRLKAGQDGVEVEDLWEDRIMNNHFNGSVAMGDFVFGFDKATFKCINALTREQGWAKRGLGKGSLIMADGLLFVLGERGKLVLVEARTDEYRELGSAQVLKGRCWTQPTLAEGVLYLRNAEHMVALRAK